MTARRYLAVVQAPEGYPASGDRLEAGPSEGPAPPTVHTVVLADDYEALEAEVGRLRPVVEHIAGLVVQDAEGYSKVHLKVIATARAALAGDAAGTEDARPDGLTLAEGRVMDALVAAYAAMQALNREHPAEMEVFGRGIHDCQAVLALRAIRRAHPEGWPRRA